MHPAAWQPNAPHDAAWRGVRVLQRGWLSSNNVLLHDDDGTAVLVDTGHVVHAAQTLALLRHALGDARLARIVNTHLHSDHCGGNAQVQRAFGARITVPVGSWRAARDWDDDALSYRATGQRCERFAPDDAVAPGDEIAVGGRRWQVHAAPGHDPDSVVLFDAAERVLISADALWEHGFGVVFPELDGGDGFDDAAAVLETIEALAPRWVVPGHGAPFADVSGALRRARERLAAFRADPDRHSRHALKVLVKYHLMEQRSEPLADCVAWFAAVPLCRAVWQRLGEPHGTPARHAEHVLRELVLGGALALDGDVLRDV